MDEVTTETTTPNTSNTALALAPPTARTFPLASEKVKAERLTPTARKEFQKAIERRSTAMLNALNGSIGGDVDTIIQNLRFKAGMSFTEAQIKDLIKGCEEQIKAEVNNHLGPVKRQIESAIELSNDDFDGQEREMKARHKAEWADLGKKRKARFEELKDQMANAEQQVIKEYTQEISDKKQNYMAELARVREIEAKITSQADQQVRLIKTRKGQLQNLVGDCTGRALEQLLMVETRKDANDLVLMIPTVQDALIMSKTARGLAELMHKLDDSIPLPVDEPEEVSSEKPDFVESEVVEADQDEEPSTTSVVNMDELAGANRLSSENNHDDVYDDDETRSIRMTNGQPTYGRR